MTDWQPTHRHYKGGLYRVLYYDVMHTETQEAMTIYQNEAGRVFARPQKMFTDNINPYQLRFTPLAPPIADTGS